jgi:hypothetical protein
MSEENLQEIDISHNGIESQGHEYDDIEVTTVRYVSTTLACVFLLQASHAFPCLVSCVYTIIYIICVCVCACLCRIYQIM